MTLLAGKGRGVVALFAATALLVSSSCTTGPVLRGRIDGLNGVGHHLNQNVDVVIAAAAEPAVLRKYARERGGDNLRLLSHGNNTVK